MQPGYFTATALVAGAPLWRPRSSAATGALGFRETGDHPEVGRRVAAGTRCTVHTTPAFAGFWWLVTGGPYAGELIRQHDPAWSVNP